MNTATMQTDDSTFADSTIQAPPSEDETMATESLEDAAMSPGSRSPFEIGNMDDHDEDTDVENRLREAGVSLPNSEELKIDRGVNDGCLKMWAWIILAFVFILSVTIGLAVGLTKDNRVQESYVTNSENSGTFVPVQRNDVMQAMMNYIIENGVSSASDFASPTSPQSKALDFLAHNDPLQLNAPRSGLESTQGYDFISRYVMSLFHASTGGEEWNYNLLFNSKYETCEWFDVFQAPIGQLGVLCNRNTKKIIGLSFHSNLLDGTIPSELGVLTSLQYFESIGNKIRGTFPSRMQDLGNLRTMIFAYNSLSGELPTWIGKMSSLEFLFLSNNQLKGSLPFSISSLRSLSVLALDGNLFTGSINLAWELPRLQFAYLEENDFVGNLPSSITRIVPLLNSLDVSGNKLSGPLPDDLFQLNHLKILDLHANSFEGPIPSGIPEVGNSQLNILALHDNMLSNHIPSEIGYLTNLEHLDLANNELSGPIPTEFTRFKELESLFLGENSFNPGSIPTFLYSLSGLKELSIKATGRNGTISESISSLSNIVLLDLDDNNLTGSIPSQIGALSTLEFLLLNRNKLSQNVPTEIGNLNDIRFLLLDLNNLTGSVQFICQKPSLSVVIADCDEVDCPCCTTCCYDHDESTCHDNIEVASMNPIWEGGFKRQFFDFANSTGSYFGVRPGSRA